MVARVKVAAAVLDWAVDRAHIDVATIHARFPRWDKWRSGEALPTIHDVEKIAAITRAPFGQFFAEVAPEPEGLPIADFRTIGSTYLHKPSPDLLDTLHLCQQRQDWFRRYSLDRGYEPVDFVGSASLQDNPVAIATAVRTAIGFDLTSRAAFKSWEAALRGLLDLIEAARVLVMVSGIVGGNTSRTLNPEEFRGFALSDDLAPLIFVNGADTKAAQIFTIVHELAHVWLGESAVSDVPSSVLATNEHEVWCNAVAAEVLVPLDHLRLEYRQIFTPSEVQRLAARYRVSTLVIIRRLRDARFLGEDAFTTAYDDEYERLREMMRRKKSEGGDFYNTHPIRVSRTFARAVLADTMEGGTLHRDAYRLLGTKKHSTFVGLSSELGVA